MTTLPDGLYVVSTSYLSAGFIIEGGKVTTCAPILQRKLTYWMTIAKRVPDSALADGVAKWKEKWNG